MAPDWVTIIIRKVVFLSSFCSVIYSEFKFYWALSGIVYQMASEIQLVVSCNLCQDTSIKVVLLRSHWMSVSSFPRQKDPATLIFIWPDPKFPEWKQTLFQEMLSKNKIQGNCWTSWPRQWIIFRQIMGMPQNLKLKVEQINIYQTLLT